MQRSASTEVLLLTAEEAAERLGIGRTKVYELLASGELVAVRIGRCRRVPVSALLDLVDRLVAASHLACTDEVPSPEHVVRRPAADGA